MDPVHRYYHALITVAENCDGCMYCLRTCPTHALRIRNGVPLLNEERCIDCGACIATCPRKALLPDVDTYTESHAFKYRVAVPSPVLYAQFGLECSLKEIRLGLSKMGFRYIYDVFAACKIQALAIQQHLSKGDGSLKKPLISSVCPAVVRLIQVKYPTLVSHVLPFEPPRELSAREAKIKVAKKHSVDIKDVGAFYISPCPAKSISVLQPAEKERSFLDGVIAISDIYKPLRQAMAGLKKEEIEAFPEDQNVFGSGWERTGFLSRSLDIKNWIAVSGLRHVVDILDHIEEGKLDGVAFVEANTCIEGCVGGSLCVENIYVARSKMLMLEQGNNPIHKPDPDWVRQLYKSGYFYMEKELRPRARKQPTPPISEGILLMKQRDELAQKLPGLDCCACGSPTCLTFAEDVLAHAVDLEACPYLAKDEPEGN
jgi:iron only hydrogenase large subunit-like protein